MLDKVVVKSSRPRDWVTGYAVHSDSVLVGDDLIGFLKGVTSAASLAGVGGSFAAIVAVAGGLRLFADRVGSRPLFHARTEHEWLVSPEFWTLTGQLGTLTPSPEAAVELLAFKCVYGNETISGRVTEVTPGAWLDLFDDGRTEEHRYWRYRTAPRERSGRALTTELADVMEGMADRSIRAGELMGLTHWGVNLTAGKDSRVLLAGLIRRGVSVTAYSSDVSGDAQVAAQLATAVGVEHRTIPFWTASGSPWVPDVADPLVATTVSAVAGHPISLALDQRATCSGFISGHLGDNFSGGLLNPNLARAARAGADRTREFVLAAQWFIAPGRLSEMLRPKWRELVGATDRRSRCLLEEMEATSAEGMRVQFDLEHRKRRYILRDYLALRSLGPTVLWFGDPAWADFWSTVPVRWQLGSPLYTRTLKERVFTGAAAPLGRIRTNGRRLDAVRLPQLTVNGRDLIRRARKRLFGATPLPADLPVQQRPSERELELASWLIEPDYFAVDRRRSEVESVRSLARATELLGA